MGRKLLGPSDSIMSGIVASELFAKPWGIVRARSPFAPGLGLGRLGLRAFQCPIDERGLEKQAREPLRVCVETEGTTPIDVLRQISGEHRDKKRRGDLAHERLMRLVG